MTSKDFVASCHHFSRNVPRKFWCGFCNECLGIDGDDAEKRWDARFDHIEDHILGRNGLKEVRADKWQPKPLLVSMVVTRVINQPSRARAYTHPQGANVTRPVELTESYPAASSQRTASASIAGIKSLKRQATLSPLQQTHEMKRSNSSSTLPSRARTPAQETSPRQEAARPQPRLNITTRVYCVSYSALSPLTSIARTTGYTLISHFYCSAPAKKALGTTRSMSVVQSASTAFVVDARGREKRYKTETCNLGTG